MAVTRSAMGLAGSGPLTGSPDSSEYQRPVAPPSSGTNSPWLVAARAVGHPEPREHERLAVAPQVAPKVRRLRQIDAERVGHRRHHIDLPGRVGDHLPLGLTRHVHDQRHLHHVGHEYGLPSSASKAGASLALGSPARPRWSP